MQNCRQLHLLLLRGAILPQAEKLNGRAAMVGYAIAWFVDSLSGWGLVDQQNSFLGKLLLHVAVFAILIFRNVEAIPRYKVCLHSKAEKLCMVAVLESCSQQNSFLGKSLLHVAVFAILSFRNVEAVPRYKVRGARGCARRLQCEQNSFLGNLLLHAAVFAVVIFCNVEAMAARCVLLPFKAVPDVQAEQNCCCRMKPCLPV